MSHTNIHFTHYYAVCRMEKRDFYFHDFHSPRQIYSMYCVMGFYFTFIAIVFMENVTFDFDFNVKSEIKRIFNRKLI